MFSLFLSAGEYEQNLCTSVNVSCEVCPERLPSCQGLPDGPQAFPTKLWQGDFIQCYLNRTVNITKCPDGKYFNPRLLSCEEDVSPGE